MSIRNQEKISYTLFLCLFYIDLFFSILPCWSGSPLYNYVSPELWAKIWLNGSLLAIILIGSLIVLNNRTYYKNDILVIMPILYILFLLSITINGFKSGGFAIIGIPISLLLFFYIIRYIRFSPFHLQLVFYILLIWSIFPILLLVIAPSIRETFFIAPEGFLMTFSGFALHRNFYGLMTGMTIILLYFKGWKLYLKIPLYIIIVIGLYLSSSRTAILAIVLTFIFIILLNKQIKKRTKLFIFSGIAVISVILYSFLTNPQYAMRNIEKDSGREQIYSGFYQIILENPFLGKGENVVFKSFSYPDGAPAHNFILQTCANFGIPTLIFWCILLLLFYRYGHPFMKLSLVYLFFWGMTQPYFGFGVFSAHIVVIFMIFRFLDCNVSTINSKF